MCGCAQLKAVGGGGLERAEGRFYNGQWEILAARWDTFLH